MNKSPGMDSIKYLCVIFAIEMRLKTASEPPGSVVMFSAVVVETCVMITIVCTKCLVVMVFSERHGVSCVAMVPVYMKSGKHGLQTMKTFPIFNVIFRIG